MIEKSREDVLQDGENIWGVSLVHPVSDEPLERCLLLVFLQRGWCSHQVVVAIAWCVPGSVLEGVVVATADSESCEEVLVVVHGKDASGVNLTEVEISCICEDVVDLRCIRGRHVRSPRSRYMPNVYHVHRKIDTIHDTSTVTRYKVGGVRRRSIYSIVLHHLRDDGYIEWRETHIHLTHLSCFR